jgi:hypothetical protein
METIHNFEAIKTFPVISDDCAIYQKRGIVGHICRVQTLTSHITLRHIVYIIRGMVQTCITFHTYSVISDACTINQARAIVGPICRVQGTDKPYHNIVKYNNTNYLFKLHPTERKQLNQTQHEPLLLHPPTQNKTNHFNTNLSSYIHQLKIRPITSTRTSPLTSTNSK